MSQVSQDWKERDFVESVECGIRKCVDFLNNFHESAKYRLSVVDARLSTLERKLDFLEASLEHCDPSKRQAKPVSFKGSIFDPEVRSKLIAQSEQIRLQNRRKFNDLVIAPRKEKKNTIQTKQQAQRQHTQTPSKQQSPQKQRQQQRPAQQRSAQTAAAVQSPSTAQPKMRTEPKPQPKQQPKPKPEPVAQQQPPAVPPVAVVPPVAPPMASSKGQEPPAIPGAAGPGAGKIEEKQQPPPIPKPQHPPKNPMQQHPPSQSQSQPPPAPSPGSGGPPPNPMVQPQPPPQPQPQPPAQVQKPPAVPGPPPGPGAAANKGPGAAPPPPGPGSPAPRKWPNEEGKTIDIMVVKEGTGAIPGGQSAVEIEYTGHLGVGGKQFIKHREVIQLGKKMNIKGLEQAVTRIKVGSQIKLWIPFRLAYGARGAGNMIPPNADLVFNLKLHRIVKQ